MPYSSAQRIAGIFAWFAICLACFLVFTLLYGARSIGEQAWFESLAKPSWAPDATTTVWAWLIVQLAQAGAVWHVWIQREEPVARTGVRFFAATNALALLWMVFLFIFTNAYCATIQIIIVWLACLATLALFWQRSLVAGLLQLPAFLWITWCGYLSFTLWQLNT